MNWLQFAPPSLFSELLYKSFFSSKTQFSIQKKAANYYNILYVKYSCYQTAFFI